MASFWTQQNVHKINIDYMFLGKQMGLIDEGKLQEILLNTLSKSEGPLCIFNFQPTSLEQPNDLINGF